MKKINYSDLSDFEVLKRAKKNKETAKVELYNRYKKLMYAYAWNLKKTKLISIDEEDLISEFTILFFEGITKCDLDRIKNKEEWKYSSYIAFVFRGYNKVIYNKYKNNNFEYELNDNYIIEDELSKVNLMYSLSIILDKKELFIVEKLLQKYKQKEIAIELKETPINISNTMKKIKQKIKFNQVLFTNNYGEIIRQ
jgi:hypothetical protein